MSTKATWKPHTEHGKLTTQSDLPDGVFAFPNQRKEPLTDASTAGGKFALTPPHALKRTCLR